ncbi:unnamed protein product, partial [Darwinula stevensoni]
MDESHGSGNAVLAQLQQMEFGPAGELSQQGWGGEIGVTALPVLESPGSWRGEAHDTLAIVGLTISASNCFMQVSSIEGLLAVLHLSHSVLPSLLLLSSGPSWLRTLLAYVKQECHMDNDPVLAAALTFLLCWEVSQ